ncbi:MAG: MFS transporter [Candidatus Limisoma sp.]
MNNIKAETDFDPYIVETPGDKLWNRNYCLVMVANFLLFFSFNNILPILPIYLAEHCGADRSVIGQVMSGFIISALFIRPFSGYIVDSLPRKKVLLFCYGAYTLLNIGYIAVTTVLAFAIVRVLQGLAFGATSVSNSTVAIDVLPSSRRSEGIGYYGISNNLAMAIGPSVALAMYSRVDNIHIVFAVPFVATLLGVACLTMVRNKPRAIVKPDTTLSLDRFFLRNSIPEGITLTTFAFSSATLTTYLAIYGKTELGIYAGSGVYFLLLAAGLIASRIATNKLVRDGKIVRCVKMGMALVTLGFVLFTEWRCNFGFYLSAIIIGVGYGTMCPSYQSMFIDLAPNSRRGTANSTYLTSWDVGAGIGIFFAGYLAEATSYHTVYRLCLGLCVVGLIAYLAFTSKHFLRNRLR